MISTAWFHRIKAAQRDLIRLAGGIERSAEISSISKSHIGRMNNATDPELMPLHAVYALESECGVPVVTSAMAELSGKRLVDPEGSHGTDHCLVAAYSDTVRKAGDLISGGAVAIADLVVTPAEAMKMDRDAAELEAGLAVLRKALAAVKARGGQKVGFQVVGGGQ
ncbi:MULTISPECIES: hypothetical protein [Rhizobium]|uniref:Uncharacterized protein n=1 Tax=Rhizobium paranaense TaxID=1650438 RepID=A0A7W9D3G9_9HYPH|nr:MULTISPECIES: hypothetical protein [Rhizobium]MBB5576362.1 hypothetical protein [Rhizobium paranaense]PST62595.1 hypothetical protein C9E91_13740 [Rhizobium sp. SEMIA4064]